MKIKINQLNPNPYKKRIKREKRLKNFGFMHTTKILILK